MKLSLEELGSLKVFKRQDSSKYDIAASGEVFYLKLYRASTAKTLSKILNVPLSPSKHQA